MRIGDNKRINWHPDKINEFVSVYDKKDIQLAKGDKIRWTKNSSKHSFITSTMDKDIEKRRI